MSDQKNWVEALNINPEKLKAWSAQAPEGTPLLVWCLVKGHVTVKSYLKWASQHFEMAVLSNEFFQNAFDLASLAEVREEGPWSPWMFPVDNWDNVTLVACVEPPSELPGDMRFVLADPRAMRQVWDLADKSSAPPPPAKTATKTKNKAAASAPAPTPAIKETSKAPPPIPLKTKAKKTAAPPVPEPEVQEPSIMVDNPDLAPPEEAEAPVGISLKTKPFKLDLGGDGNTGTSLAMPTPDDEPMVIDAEPEITETPSEEAETPSEEAEVPAGFVLDLKPPTLNIGGIDDSSSSSITQDTPTEAPPPVTQVKPKPKVREHSVVTDITGPTKLSKKPVASSSKSKVPTGDEASAFQMTVDLLKEHYQHVFVMRADGETLKMHLWDSGLTPQDPAITVDLGTPTFFRIVAKTTLPYHGFLVDLPAHREFFNNLGMDELPGCVTAVPLSNESLLLGVLVAVGTVEQQKLGTLKIAEDAGASLAKVVAESWAA